MSAAKKPVSLKKQEPAGAPAAAEAKPVAPVAAPTSRGDGLVLIMARNQFYSSQAQNMLMVVLAQFAILLLMIFITVRMFEFTGAHDYYFPVNDDNSLLLEQPLTTPIFSDADILKWAENAVTDTMTFGYYDHLTRLQHARNYFTVKGWSTFTNALESAGVLATINAIESPTTKGVDMVISSQLRPNTKAVLTKQGVWGGRHFWTIQMEIGVNYQRGPLQTLMPWQVEIDVIRLPATESRDGVGIERIIATSSKG